MDLKIHRRTVFPRSRCVHSPKLHNLENEGSDLIVLSTACCCGVQFIVPVSPRQGTQTLEKGKAPDNMNALALTHINKLVSKPLYTLSGPVPPDKPHRGFLAHRDGWEIIHL